MYVYIQHIQDPPLGRKDELQEIKQRIEAAKPGFFTRMNPFASKPPEWEQGIPGEAEDLAARKAALKPLGALSITSPCVRRWLFTPLWEGAHPESSIGSRLVPKDRC